MAGGLRRRTLMQAAPALLLAAAGGRGARAQAQAQAPRPALPIPPLLEGRGDQPLRLTAGHGDTRFWPGRAASRTAGYNGSYLGPTLRLRNGNDVPVEVRSTLEEDTTVHWHGLLVPSTVDGGPHNVIAPGASWRPVLPIRQPATTAWYHAHPHGRTGFQTYHGLAGMMIIDDAQDTAPGLPARYGVDDLPLILQDRVFDGTGRLVYPMNHMAAMHGVRGPVLLANGVPQPAARVPAGLVRLRLLNAANARNFDLAFDDGRTFHWIATEGGLLRRPVARQRLELLPGQRAELLVDFSDGRPATLTNGADAAFPMMDRGGRRPVVHFTPAGAGQAPRIPAALAHWDTPDRTRVARRRRIVLTMGMPMGMGGRGGSHGHGGADGGGRAHGIDGRPYAMDRIDQEVRLGDVEIWEVSADRMPHPFHIHGVHFEVLSRGGRPADPEDQGRRDTVMVDEPVELLVQFTQPAPEVPFMYHCHVLEHEDLGMMGQFTVA